MPCTIGLTTVPVRAFGAGGGSGTGIISLPDVEHVLFVDKGSNVTEDGTRQQPFHTVEAALTAAAALTPAADNPVVIYVLPGLYEEEGLQSINYVRVIGVNRNTCRIEATNDVVFTISHTNFTLEQLWLNQLGDSPIIEFDSILSNPCRLYDCRLETELVEAGPAILVSKAAMVSFERCRFVATEETLPILILDDGNSEVLVHNCEVLGTLTVEAGNLTVQRTKITGSIDYNSSDQNALTLLDNTIGNSSNVSAVHLGATPPATLTIKDNALSSGTSPDVNATGTAVGYISGNVMYGIGYASYVNPVGGVRYVGAAGDVDFHPSTDVAILNVYGSAATIEYLKDDVFTSGNVTLPNTVKFTLRGNGHELGYGGGSWNQGFIIGTLGLYIYNMSYKLRSFTRSGPLYMYDCTMTGRVDIEGQPFYCYRTTIVGSVALVNAIIFTSAAAGAAVIDSSRLKGYTNNPAVMWNAAITNDNLKIKNSTIEHGSLGANNPFGRGGAQTPTYRSHHTGYNSDPETGGIWTNAIAVAERYDSIDPATDY